jgi:hypothetical protein
MSDRTDLLVAIADDDSAEKCDALTRRIFRRGITT